MGGARAEIAQIEQQSALPDFWSNAEVSQNVLRRLSLLKNRVTGHEKVCELFDESSTLVELALETGDVQIIPETIEAYEVFLAAFEDLRVATLLSGEYDANNAICSLHPGAGGTESCDWAGMLLRMYGKWAEKKGFKFEIVDILEGDEAGIKSATFQISGSMAFGLLKSEKGIHRLVRISPFDSGGRRHTSFASCDVMPEIDDATVEISSEDLKIDTFRAGGAGGQHVNKTESAVRITHMPTGIVVSCQNERSQLHNRDRAMKILTGKLYLHQKQIQMQKLSDIRGAVMDNAFGSQIRSYVFHPYSLVKDHRTNEETSSVQAVMDGRIDGFINAFLLSATKSGTAG